MNRRPHIALAAALALACAPLAVSGCATAPGAPSSYSVERAAALARASHATSCGAVETLHASGSFTGAAFNRAKLLCVQTDQMLDAADAAIILNDLATAQAKISAAQDGLSDIKSITPKAH